jgi:hypothetical protein
MHKVRTRFLTLVAGLDGNSSKSGHLEGLYRDDYWTSDLLCGHVIIFLIYFMHGLSLCGHNLRLLEPHSFMILRWLGAGQNIRRVTLDFSSQPSWCWTPSGVFGWDTFPSGNVITVRRVELVIAVRLLGRRWDHVHAHGWRLLRRLLRHFRRVVHDSPVDPCRSHSRSSRDPCLSNISSLIHRGQHISFLWFFLERLALLRSMVRVLLLS